MRIPTMGQALFKLPASVALGSGRVLTVAIEFATTIYLMRLLGPEPFGLLAMATGLLVAFAVFKDAGAGASLVSDRHLTDSKVGAASLIAFLFGVSAMIIALACTPLVVDFYGDERLTPIWIIVCLALWLAPMSSLPNSLAQREHRFWLISWVPLIGAVGASAAALLLVQVRQDYWPILAFQVVGGVLSFIALWLLVRPKLAWPSKQDVREVFHFGRGLVGFDALNILNRYADNIIIGFFAILTIKVGRINILIVIRRIPLNFVSIRNDMLVANPCYRHPFFVLLSFPFCKHCITITFTIVNIKEGIGPHVCTRRRPVII